VGKGEEMSSVEISCQGVLEYGEKEEERPHPYGYACGDASRMNEDDDKLKNFVTEEKDQRSILVIGGIHIFLLRNQGEVSIGVAYATER
jgi:hypothetical protein